MAERSKIEWTDATWTPIQARRKDTGKVGVHCVKVSPECAHCYAERLNKRGLPSHGTGLPFTVLSGEKVTTVLNEEILLAPLRWRRPRRIFVCSQTDLFGDWVPDEMIDRIFAVMALSPQHTFQVLTKRSARMRDYLTKMRLDEGIMDSRAAIATMLERPARFFPRALDRLPLNRYDWMPWPLPNVWLGVTAGAQQSADDRIPDLLATPAAVRFVSCEPLLGPVELPTRFLVLGRIAWVIAGGESGPGARPMHPDWARSLRDQCVAAGVPFFLKQWGDWAPGEIVPDGRKYPAAIEFDGSWKPCSDDWWTEADHGPIMYRLGKEAAGRLLDGREWNELPEVSHG